MPDSNLVSVKELALKLKVSDALLKKFIRDFSIPTERIKKLIHVSNDAVDILKEIIRLRDSGKKNKEIKELFDQSRKGEFVTKEAEKSEDSSEEKDTTKDTKTTKAKKSSETEESEEATETAEDKGTEKVKAKSKTTKKKKDSKAKTDKEDKASASKDEKPKEEKKEGKNVSEEYYQDFIDDQIHENEVDPDIQAALDSEDEDDFEDEDEDEEQTESGKDSTGSRDNNKQKRRRRQFSFRYIQRQIANDNKRINYIRHKLSRGKLSLLERKHLEDSLDKRSKLLHGWMQLLRWVKS